MTCRDARPSLPGCSGIGKAIALTLADAGADVVATDVLPEIEQTSAEIRERGRRSLAIPTDVRQTEQVDAMVEATVAEFSKVVILVSNAGIDIKKPLILVDGGSPLRMRAEAHFDSPLVEEEWEAMLDINLKGYVRCAVAVGSNDRLLWMYRTMVTTRKLYQTMFDLYRRGSGQGNFVAGEGEEAIPAAICANLRSDDSFKPNFRQTSCLFAKEGYALADIFSGSLFDTERGYLGFSLALGEDVGIYTGFALLAQMRGTDQVCVCAFGEGTASKGSIHEAMVIAAAWKLPIVVVLQNNKYCGGTRYSKVYRFEDLSDRARGYGIPARSRRASPDPRLGRRAWGSWNLTACRTLQRQQQSQTRSRHRLDQVFAQFIVLTILCDWASVP